MESIERMRISIPKKVYDGMFPLLALILFNISVLSTCSFLGCYEINFTNAFRLNLHCNACTDISYHLQGHQVKIYLFIGGYLLKRINEVIDQQIINIYPSSN